MMNTIGKKLVKANRMIPSIFVPAAFVSILMVTNVSYSAQHGDDKQLFAMRLHTPKHALFQKEKLALRVTTSQPRLKQRLAQQPDFTLSWDEIISPQPFTGKKVRSVSWTSKIIPLSPPQSLHKTSFSQKDVAIKVVSKKMLQKYRSRKVSLPAGWPVKKGRVSSVFGWRGKRMHKGIDIAAKTGTAVFAVEDGVVLRAKRVGAYGLLVEIEHSEMYTTRYAHNSKLLVKAGEYVVKGQKIAKVGSTGRSTGPHLHFEVRQSGVAINPLRYLGAMEIFTLLENISLSKYVKLTKK